MDPRSLLNRIDKQNVPDAAELMLRVIHCCENQTGVAISSKQRQFLLSDKDPCGWPMRRFLFLISYFYIGNPKNCKHKKNIQKKNKKWPMSTENMAKKNV